MRKFSILIIIATFFACSDDFLDKEPTVNSSVEIETVEDLDKVFNASSYLMQDPVNIFSTDNAGVPVDLFDEGNNLFSPPALQNYLWSTSVNESSDATWAWYYNTIWEANLAINLIANNEVSGDEGLKRNVKAEAHYKRASSLFELALFYNLYPNAANADEKGLVLRLGTSFSESQTRATLGETFAQIEADLEEALKHTQNELVYNRATKPTINAFAAQYYLYRGNYEKAEQYATAALNEHSTMIDFSTSITALPANSDGVVYPSTSNISAFSSLALEFFEDQYIFKISSNRAENTSPSQELLDLYDAKDLRNVFFVKDYFKKNSISGNPWYGYIVFGGGYILTGTSVAEMYLTRAECKARKGDLNGAMADLEMVRVNRFHTEDYIALPVPADNKATVETIIDERRREFPFSRRWMDIKRLNNDPLTDDIVMTRNFYEISEDGDLGSTPTNQSILPDDRRYARPIGDDVIISSNGATTQNDY